MYILFRIIIMIFSSNNIFFYNNIYAIIIVIIYLQYWVFYKRVLCLLKLNVLEIWVNSYHTWRNIPIRDNWFSNDCWRPIRNYRRHFYYTYSLLRFINARNYVCVHNVTYHVCTERLVSIHNKYSKFKLIDPTELMIRQMHK